MKAYIRHSKELSKIAANKGYKPAAAFLSRTSNHIIYTSLFTKTLESPGQRSGNIRHSKTPAQILTDTPSSSRTGSQYKRAAPLVSSKDRKEQERPNTSAPRPALSRLIIEYYTISCTGATVHSLLSSILGKSL